MAALWPRMWNATTRGVMKMIDLLLVTMLAYGAYASVDFVIGILEEAGR